MEINLTAIDKSDADPKVKEVYKLLKKYMKQPERTKWLAKRADCWDSVYEYDDDSTIWTEKQRDEMTKKGMVPLAINDLYKGVQGSAAIITDQKPGVMFLPVGSGDLYVAELMKRAFDHAWTSNEGSSEVYEFVKEAKVGGLACLDAKHDPSKGIYGKCVFGNYNPENIYYDMNKSRKPDLSDTTILKAQLVSKTYAKETYDVKDEDLVFKMAQKPDDLPVQDTATGVDNYTRDTKSDSPADSEDFPEEKEDIWEIEAHILARRKELWLMTPDGAGGWGRKVFKKDQEKEAEAEASNVAGSVIWKRTVEKRLLRIIIGKKLVPQTLDDEEVDEIENPYGVDNDGDPILPVIVLTHDRTRKGKPLSPTVFAKEACRERNKRRTQAIYVVSKNLDAPIVTSGGSKWKKDAVYGDILECDKAQAWPPFRLVPGTVSTETLNLEQVAKQDVDDMYDMQDVMKGKMPKGDPSGRIVLALQDMAGMMSKPFTRNMEAALVRLGKVIAAIQLKTYTRAMWERLIEPDEWGEWEPEEKKKPTNPIDALNGGQQQPDQQMQQMIRQKWEQALELIRPKDETKESGVSLLDMDVRVSAGSTMPTNRMAKQVAAMEMVTAGVYDREAALDYIDDPKKDLIIARTKAQDAAMMAAGINKSGGKTA